MIDQADVEKINGLKDAILLIRPNFDDGIRGTNHEFQSLGRIIMHLQSWAIRTESIAQRMPHDQVREEIAQACKEEVASLLNAYNEERIESADPKKIIRFMKESLEECDRIMDELGRLIEYYCAMAKPN